MWVTGPKYLLILCCFPRLPAGNQMTTEAAGTWSGTHVRCWCCGWWPYLLCCSASPDHFLFLTNHRKLVRIKWSSTPELLRIQDDRDLKIPSINRHLVLRKDRSGIQQLLPPTPRSFASRVGMPCSDTSCSACAGFLLGSVLWNSRWWPKCLTPTTHVGGQEEVLVSQLLLAAPQAVTSI